MNEEMLKRLAGGVKSPEEVVAIAKEYGKELTLEQAKGIYDRVKHTVSGELSDDDLEAVAGGEGYLFDPLLEEIGSWFGK